MISQQEKWPAVCLSVLFLNTHPRPPRSNCTRNYKLKEKSLADNGCVPWPLAKRLQPLLICWWCWCVGLVGQHRSSASKLIFHPKFLIIFQHGQLGGPNVKIRTIAGANIGICHLTFRAGCTDVTLNSQDECGRGCKAILQARMSSGGYRGAEKTGRQWLYWQGNLFWPKLLTLIWEIQCGY